jgi:hypothetical protein
VGDFLSIDRSITQHDLVQAQRTGLNRYIGQIPTSVLVVLALAIFMAAISWAKVRRRETL